MVFSKSFAEFVGAVIGDGNIYDKGPSYVELCGDPLLDSDYMKKLSNYVREELLMNNTLKIRSFGLRLRINNKQLVELLKDIGIPIGKKKHSTVKIPPIIASDIDLALSCVRGIFDTDGCIFYDKRKVYKVPYPRICLHMTSKPLLRQIKNILLSVDINAKLNTDGKNLSINGKHEVNKFLQVIGFSNKRHIIRVTPQ